MNIDGAAVEKVIKDNNIILIPYINPQKFIGCKNSVDIRDFDEMRG